jgi:GNAT superfamily N-acetyltransferase
VPPDGRDDLDSYDRRVSAGVTVRRATSDDAAALALSRYRFRAHLDDAEHHPAGLEAEDVFVGRATRFIEAQLSSDRWSAWVGSRDGDLCAHVFLQLIDKLPNPDSTEPELLGYLTSFFVEPELRGEGVGSALLDALESHAAERGVEKILIIGNTVRSRPLYARRGYVSGPDLLQKRLTAHA